jgi:hypothetical protein
MILQYLQRVRAVAGSPTCYNGLMDAQAAAAALGLADENYVYRLCRSGRLVATKVNGVWNIDPDSVELRRLRLAHKRSSAVNAHDARQQRRAEAAARYDA